MLLIIQALKIGKKTTSVSYHVSQSAWRWKPREEKPLEQHQVIHILKSGMIRPNKFLSLLRSGPGRYLIDICKCMSKVSVFCQWKNVAKKQRRQNKPPADREICFWMRVQYYFRSRFLKFSFEIFIFHSRN